MTWSEVAQLITAVAAIGAVLMSYRNSRKIEQVHVSINSRMDQLLKTSGDAMKAEGVAEERANNIAKGA
jgi:hypothetical protein